MAKDKDKEKDKGAKPKQEAQPQQPKAQGVQKGDRPPGALDALERDRGGLRGRH